MAISGWVYYTLQTSFVTALDAQYDKTLPESLLLFWAAQDNPSLPISYGDFLEAVSMLQDEGTIVVNDTDYGEPEIELVRSDTK